MFIRKMRRLAYIKQKKLSFSYHLADHCNLNCKGCDNFSPIAPERYTDIGVFERDLRRIKEIMQDNISELLLLGGEPLLNKKINDYFSIARDIFQDLNIDISIVTNGILLPNMPDDFWECCSKNSITVSYTKYPILLDWKKIERKASSFGVNLLKYGRGEDVEKTLQFDPFDILGNQDIKSNFKNCFHANKCIQLREGKLYTCNIRAYADIFCEKFGVNMELSTDDYLDIYSRVSVDEVFTFLSEPISFCKYCYIEKRNEGHVWRGGKEGLSKYDWLIFSFDEYAMVELSRYGRVLFVLGEDIDEEIIWNREFKKRDSYIVVKFEQIQKGFEMYRKEMANVVVSKNQEVQIKIEEYLYKNGFQNIYIADV